MSLRKLFIKAFCLIFSFNENLRSYIQFVLFNFHLSDRRQSRLFLNKEIKPNSVLLFEPNDVHGEVVLGYVKYFADLGYNVDVILNKDVYKEDPFCRLPHGYINELYYIGARKTISLFKSSDKIFGYKHILITSATIYAYEGIGCIELMPEIKRHPSVYIVKHDIEGIKDELASDKIITLGYFPNYAMVNPHFFYKIQPHSKNKKTRFVVVGSVRNHRKNHDLLKNVAQKLFQTSTNFEVVVVGNRKVIGVIKNLKSILKFTGRLNFESMFKEIEKSDFLLFLLDPENEAHNRYITTGVTGSAQLAYGFNLPSLVHKKFANFYSLNNKNSLIYEDDIYEKMLEAINMSPEKYSKMKEELLKTSQRIEKESLINLKKMLK